MNRKEELNDLYLSYCKDPIFSHLRESGSSFVPGSGPLDCRVMIIGEAPGEIEDGRQIPFVGQSGANLAILLQGVGIEISNVFYTNTVKYWTSYLDTKGIKRTRTPSEEEIKLSIPYLRKEIEIVEPTVIGLAGHAAITGLFPEIKNVFSRHGELLDDLFVPLYHPATLTHLDKSDLIPQIKSGYKKLKKYLDYFES